jgi:hypothetical protein
MRTIRCGLIDVHPSPSLRLSERISMATDFNIFWKHQIED